MNARSENPVARSRHSPTDTVDLAAATGPAPAVAPTPGRFVLVVDDEPNILAALQRLLRREPYTLLTAKDAAEALTILEGRSVQVVVSDYRMPGLTGTDLLREVQERWPDTIRIILTGYSEIRAIISAINDGAVYKFISKPWNDEEVKLHLRRAVEQADLRQENHRLTRELARQNAQLLELNRLLDERATDASAGQMLAQLLHESIGAGVLAIDADGLVVGGNRQACELLAPAGSPVIGMPARIVLPRPLFQTLGTLAESAEPEVSGRLEHHGRRLQWRARHCRLGNDPSGMVVTLWENL